LGPRAISAQRRFLHSGRRSTGRSSRRRVDPRAGSPAHPTLRGHAPSLRIAQARRSPAGGLLSFRRACRKAAGALRPGDGTSDPSSGQSSVPRRRARRCLPAWRGLSASIGGVGGAGSPGRRLNERGP
jgi:hypothetical protein